MVEELYIKGMSPGSDQIRKAIKDAYPPGYCSQVLETEVQNSVENEGRWKTLSMYLLRNLRQLLLSSPIGSKRDFSD
jgi:hypothetical protein